MTPLRWSNDPRWVSHTEQAERRTLRLALTLIAVIAFLIAILAVTIVTFLALPK